MAKLSLGIFLLLLVPVRDLRAQDKREYGSVPREKVFQSRAEFEAEQRVSLSAEKIIDLLQQEPGLLLQVKKMLVRKAFEQGRILDPTDLTDEALFRLLRESSESNCKNRLLALGRPVRPSVLADISTSRNRKAFCTTRAILEAMAVRMRWWSRWKKSASL